VTHNDLEFIVLVLAIVALLIFIVRH